jgi:hypothetical protein
MTALYQIIDWYGRHESNRSRQIERCAYLMAPNDFGPIFYAISGNSNGEAILGIWFAIVALCSCQRKPREGYLTNDGRADGWRLSAEELAHMWKFSPANVRRALLILSDRRVGLMRLVEGVPEVYTPDASIVRPPPHLKCADDRTSSALEAVNVTEVQTEVQNPPVVPPRGDRTRKSLTFEEAKAWVDALFGGRKMAWSYEEMHLLEKLLPIDPEVRAMLSWGYTLPRDEQGWALVNGEQVNKPKTSCIRFLREFGSEAEKWRVTRSTLNGEMGEEEESDGWTNERVELRDELFPDATQWPDRFRDLPVDVQRRFNEVVNERKEQNV